MAWYPSLSKTAYSIMNCSNVTLHYFEAKITTQLPVKVVQLQKAEPGSQTGI